MLSERMSVVQHDPGEDELSKHREESFQVEENFEMVFDGRPRQQQKPQHEQKQNARQPKQQQKPRPTQPHRQNWPCGPKAQQDHQAKKNGGNPDVNWEPAPWIRTFRELPRYDYGVPPIE